MLLAISILLGIAIILDTVQKENGNFNMCIAAALTISLWPQNIPLAIISLVVYAILFIILMFND